VRECRRWVQSACPWWEDRDDLFDGAEVLEHTPHGEKKASSRQLALEPVEQEEYESAGEHMDAHFLVRPVISRPKVDVVGVSPSTEAGLNVGWRTVGQNDLNGTPFRVVGKEKGWLRPHRQAPRRP